MKTVYELSVSEINELKKKVFNKEKLKDGAINVDYDIIHIATKPDEIPDNCIYKIFENVDFEESDFSKENNTLRVCEYCLLSIESRGEDVSKKTVYVDEDDEEESLCQLCGENGFDKLYEIKS